MELFLRNSASSFLFEVWYFRRGLILSAWRFEFGQVSSTKHAWRTDLNWVRNCQLSRARSMRGEQALIGCETVSYFRFIRFFSSLFSFRFLHTHRDLLISSRADRWDLLCGIRLLHSCSKSDISVEAWFFLPGGSNSARPRARNRPENQGPIR